MRLSAHVTLGLLALAALAACVDGKTPDCSDAAAQCGPDLDGEVPDGATDGPQTDGTADAPGDAPGDAPTDAGKDTNAPPADASEAGQG